MIYVCIEQLILRMSIKKKKTNLMNLRYCLLHYTMMRFIIIKLNIQQKKFTT